MIIGNLLVIISACYIGIAESQTRFTQFRNTWDRKDGSNGHGGGPPIHAKANNENYYIMLDGMSVFTCNGVENQFTVDRKNIKITDEYGNEARYIKGPGTYYIQFDDLEVPHELQNLAGEIGASLQVPVFEGPGGLRFDLPYQVIPEVGIINAKCDEQSGVVEHQGQRSQKYFWFVDFQCNFLDRSPEYTRYCNLCATATDVSRTVERDARKFIPELETGQETADDYLEPICGRISAKKYSLKRKINLPTKAELEEAGNKHFSGINQDVKKRLEKGTGRFHVFLNLITSDNPPNNADNFFSTNGACQCYSSRFSNSLQCNIRNQFGTFLFRTAEQCKSDYVNQCLVGNYKTAACYSVEFNYKLAVDYNEVRHFLSRKGLKDEQGIPRTTTTPKPARRSQAQIKHECIRSIPISKLHVQRYCKIFWNESLCCSECKGVCNK